jgi:hypothetical protein
VIFDHVFRGLGLVEDGGEIGLCGHFEDVAAVDVQVVLSNLLTDETPDYSRGYVPEEVGLLFLLKGDGQVLV